MEVDTPILNPSPPVPISPSVTDAQMRMVLDVSRMLAVASELDPLLRKIAEACCGLLGCERASIFLHDAKTDELWSKVALESGEIRIPAGTGIIGHAFASNAMVNVPAPYDDPRFNPEPDRRSGFVTRSLLACPMSDIDGRPLGVIEAVNKRGGVFWENDFAMIRLLAEQAGVAIQRYRLAEQAMQTVALRQEMKLARRAQEALIPKNPPKIPGLDAVGWSLPASMTGGDCFDFWTAPDGRLGIFLADASGHGLAPALVVSQTRTLVRALGDIETDPHRLLARAHARLCDDLEPSQFVTAFLAFIASDGAITWSSAGHGPVYVRRTADAQLELLEPPCGPLGVRIPWPDSGPPPVRMQAGGSLILVSDGIFESADPGDAMFGVERMMALLDAHRHSPPEEVSAALREAVRQWRGPRDAEDDQTIVIVQQGE